MDGNFDVAVDKLIRHWCPTLEDKELKWVHQLDFGEKVTLPFFVRCRRENVFSPQLAIIAALSGDRASCWPYFRPSLQRKTSRPPVDRATAKKYRSCTQGACETS